MPKNKVSKLIRWWVTPKLPIVHIFSGHGVKPKNIVVFIKLELARWLIHPVKRRIAKYYLFLLRKYYNLKVIAITGSAGKTTSKEMLTSILSLKGETVSSLLNIDPVYNIPSTILRCKPVTKYLVLEMGVEYPGEMDFYLWFGKPDISVITNIYFTHTEFFGDSGGVFREKSKLVKELPRQSVAILNMQDKFLRRLKDDLKAKVSGFGNGENIMSSQERFTKDYKTEFLLIFDQNPKKRVRITLPIYGRQFINSALAAASVAYNLGFPIKTVKKGLEIFIPPDHRMKVIKHPSGAIIVDDSYNNNPSAAKEAIENFIWLARERNRVIVFGDMLELGYWEEISHKRIGELLGKLNLTKLICIGKVSKITAYSASIGLGKDSVGYFKTWRGAIGEIKKYLRTDSAILIKGSRSLELDKMVAQLVANTR